MLLRRRGRRAARAPPGTLGATYTPDCAAIHPARLVRGLADAVERRASRIHERTPRPRSSQGSSAPARDGAGADVVRATEGFTSRLPGSAAP